MAVRNCVQGLISVRSLVACARSGSYNDSTEACANTSVPPRVAGCSGFGSTFVGRPMWLSTSTGVAAPANGIAVA